MSKIIYKYHKQIDNPLHKAAFRGKVEKINSLINSNISPYKTTSGEETPLHLSLSKGHENAANIFFNILEIDLTAARHFLKEHKINVGPDNENFVMALGKSQIELVRQKCGEMIVNPKDVDVSALVRCAFVLTKENIYSIPDVLAFRPNNEVQRFTLLSTVFHLLKENGVISLNVQRSTDHSTVLHLAAARGYKAMVMKLLDLGKLHVYFTNFHFSNFLIFSGANPFLKDNVHQTAIGAAHSTGEFPTYVEMCNHLNLNMFATKDFVRLPISNAVWENVEFLIETLVVLRIEKYQENREKAVRNVLSMNEIAGTFLLSNIGEKCLEKYGHHMPEQKLSKIIMLLINYTTQKSDTVMRFIRHDYTIVKEKTSRVIQYRTHNTVLHTLVRNGWNDEVREIYQEFPRLKSLLFEHKELGLSALIQCIQSDHVELAQFLIKEHESEINRPEHWSQLLIAAAELPGSIDFLKLILENDMTDPNLVLHGDQYIYTNALFVCIAKGNLEKVKVILESNKMTDLNIIKGKFDVTLLQSAICSMNSTTIPFNVHDYHSRPSDQFKYCTNDLDTSEDEDESSDQRGIETNGENQPNATRYAIMNEIFDKLIEKGANFKHIDSSCQTLLHHAVNRSNKYVVEKLLGLGLDPLEPDRNGNLALHYLSDVEIFNILKNHKTFEESVTARNKNMGATILHICVRSKNDSVDLCSKLIDNGIDVNALDHAGNSPLHNSVMNQTTSVCEFLINCNANLNWKNKNGQTAAHIALSMGNFDAVALLFKQPTLDLFMLTNSGKSYLTQLTTINDCNFRKINASLETRKEQLDHLIELYCNETDDDGVSNLFHSTNNKYLLDLLIAQPHIEVNVEASKYNDLLLHTVRDDLKLAKFLVDKGLDVNKVDTHLRTPLIEALTVNREANVEVVKYLVETAGANVNYVGWQGTSPLHVACVYFNLESIRILLEAGADYKLKDGDGKNPFERLPIEYRSIIANIIEV